VCLRAILGYGGVLKTVDVSLSIEEGGFGWSVEEIRNGSGGESLKIVDVLGLETGQRSGGSGWAAVIDCG